MKNTLFLLLCICLSVHQQNCYSQSQGPNLPDSVFNCSSCAGTSWIPNGSSWGHFLPFLPNGGLSKPLFFSHYGFSIPGGAIITGIQADLPADFISGSVTDTIVQLKYASALTGSNLATNTTFNGTARTYGGPADLWGATLTPAMVNDTSFGIGIAVVASTNSNGGIDDFSLTVFYSSGTGTDQSLTGFPFENLTSWEENDALVVSFESNTSGENGSLVIRNIGGMQMAGKNFSFQNGKNIFRFDSGSWASGIYFISLSTEDGIHAVRRIMIP